MRTRTLSAKMTTREKQYLAQQMCAYTPQVLHGPIGEPSSWRCALRRIGCRVITVRTEPEFVASYNADSDSRRYPVGEVIYNRIQPKRLQARGLAHEFGHALQQVWIPQMIFNADVVYSYHDDGRSVRHQIARLFERMMLE